MYGFIYLFILQWYGGCSVYCVYGVYATNTDTGPEAMLPSAFLYGHRCERRVGSGPVECRLCHSQDASRPSSVLFALCLRCAEHVRMVLLCFLPHPGTALVPFLVLFLCARFDRSVPFTQLACLFIVQGVSGLTLISK